MNDLARFLTVIVIVLIVLVSVIFLGRSFKTKDKPTFNMGPGWTCLAWHNETVPAESFVDPGTYLPYQVVKQVTVCDTWKRLSKPATETQGD
jgi:hypothetical protein